MWSKDSGPSMEKVWVPVVIVICLCSLGLFIWRSTNQGTVVLKVETIPAQRSILELQRVIEAQKKTIDLYAKRPKVVFRCLDDEPKLKYPRHASDDYTSVMMGTNDKCGKTSEMDAVVLVHSSAGNFAHRERFRNMYSNHTVTKPYKLKMVFLIGQVEDAALQINLELENRQFGDTIQGNFIDTYQNLTLKAVMGYRWIVETCQDVKLLLKMDDDVALDVHKFFGEYWHNLRKDKKVKRIFCQMWKNAVVNRRGKWKVEKGLFRNETYDFPYCSGFFVVVTADLIADMYRIAKDYDFFWIDDVFLYGMVTHNINNVGFTQLGAKGYRVTQTQSVYEKCREKKGMDCPYLAIVTDSGDTLTDTFNHFPHQLLQHVKPNTTEKVSSKSSIAKSGNAPSQEKKEK